MALEEKLTEKEKKQIFRELLPVILDGSKNSLLLRLNLLYYLHKDVPLWNETKFLKKIKKEIDIHNYSLDSGYLFTGGKDYSAASITFKRAECTDYDETTISVKTMSLDSFIHQKCVDINDDISKIDLIKKYLHSKCMMNVLGRLKKTQEIISDLMILLKHWHESKRQEHGIIESTIKFDEVRDVNELLECASLEFKQYQYQTEKEENTPQGHHMINISIHDAYEYQPICRIGSGSKGTVYLAEASNLGQRVAIKLILTDDETGYLNECVIQEARLMAKIEGKDLENIVRIYYAGSDIVKQDEKEKYAIVMEYVDGQTLEKILKERKLSTHEVLDYSAQILNGIQSLRRLGITHRDLNPRNIKLNSSGKIKILDFGIATDDQSPKAKDNRRYGALEGNDADDLFSFGLLLYKMATGEHLVYTRKAEMGEETYAKNIAQLKSEIYLDDGNLKREYREKIAAVGVVPYKPLNGSETMACITPEIRKILVSCFEKEEIDQIKRIYPEPFYFYLCSRDELIDILWKGGFSASFCAYIQKRQK